MSDAAAWPGLSAEEAARRLAADGPNVLVPQARGTRWRRLLGPLADPMVALLLVAAPTYLLIGDSTDAIVVFVALVPIAGVGWLLEARAERTLERLRNLTAPTAVVFRDGERHDVPTVDLVVGDIVVVQEGDIVPADAEIVELTQLLVDESPLTGESLPATKEADAGSEAGMVWAGTTVLTGRAVARVVATGQRTRYGTIGALVAAARPPATPLQRALGRLVRLLAIAAAVFCAAVIVAELVRGRGWGDAVIAGVSLAIAAIPEEFSMVYALYLALGAWQLAKDKALVRRLPGVETLGSVTVICTDKTGTLTEGRLTVGALIDSDGDTAHIAPTVDSTVAGTHRRLLEAAVLACEPDPFDPLDRAIVAHARAAGIDVDRLHRGTLVTDWPFDPADKYLTHRWRLVEGDEVVAAKGSVEGLLAHTRSPNGSMEAPMAVHDRLADDGMRLIAVAGGAVQGPTGDRAADERDLELLGMVAFSDPIRPRVASALEECRTAGIRVIMITGDHPATAHAVAEGLRLPHDGRDGDLIATGDDLDAAGDERFAELAATANVFARARPEHKHRLVQALRAQGEVVAMTGDGTNDAPALRAADIGVAMGERGTDVARDAATMVLLDDNFATIVTAVHNGRRIYDNLAHAFGYLVAFHPPLLFAALLVPLLGEPLLLLPVHLILLELLLHPIVSLVFQADPAESDVMARPPRSASSGLGLRALWRPYVVGTVLAGGLVGGYLTVLHRGWPVEQARGFGLAILLASQPLLLVVERSPHAPLWRTGLRPTRQLAVAVAVIVAVTVAAIYVGPFARLLQVASFPTVGWAAVVGVACVATLWSEPLKRPI